MTLRQNSQHSAMTIGQIAKRWGVARNRVQSLVDSGEIRGAFLIPSTGRYGETLKIPYGSVLEAEERWALSSGNNGIRKRAPRTHNNSQPTLKHFPELDVSPESPVGTHEDELC